MSSYAVRNFALALVVPLVALGPVSGQLTVKSKAHAENAPTTATRSSDFLHSIGVCSAISRRGESLASTIESARYLGLGWLRAGYESDVPVADLIELHRKAGVRFSYGLGSGGTDLVRLLDGARQLAKTGALLALEGPNEPNNWGITYQGQTGGKNLTWLPVAKLQSDLYKAVKSDPLLKRFPVWSISEGGAETDNVGLQFLKIPPGVRALMPAGTRYADYANVHNYIYHPNARGLEDNKTWMAADPSPACKVDGLHGEYGVTWARKYPGYSPADLMSLPRVTTETGCAIDGPVTEQIHALNLISLYLDQFKRGWSHTAVYLLRDRVDEGGNQRFGFYKPDDTPQGRSLPAQSDHGSGGPRIPAKTRPALLLHPEPAPNRARPAPPEKQWCVPPGSLERASSGVGPGDNRPRRHLPDSQTLRSDAWNDADADLAPGRFGNVNTQRSSRDHRNPSRRGTKPLIEIAGHLSRHDRYRASSESH